MITFFTNPRPFTGPFGVIQRNALKSWQKLGGGCEIILFEDEEGTTSAVAAELGLKCLKPACNEFGTPLLDHEFAAVKAAARNGVLAHVNTDILLFPDFLAHVTKTAGLLAGRPFFMIGRRWDLDVTEPIDFTDPGWEGKVKAELNARGELHGISGIDYWVFPKDTPFDPPAFNVGRPGMDSWLVYRARRLGIPVVDATAAITIVHQNHNYPRKALPHFAVEAAQNLELGQSRFWGMSLLDADWLLDGRGLGKPPFPRRLFSMLSLLPPWRVLIMLKRKFQALFA